MTNDMVRSDMIRIQSEVPCSEDDPGISGQRVAEEAVDKRDKAADKHIGHADNSFEEREALERLPTELLGLHRTLMKVYTNFL
jgi:hypothetical protein